jgi:4'-phosphopantetheinyl transferase
MGAPAPVTACSTGLGDLADGEVHTWIVDLDASADDSGGLLDAAERDRAASYLSPLEGARFATSRAFLRRILGRYLCADPAGLRFDTGPGGRPVLVGQHGPPGQDTALQFSLSRSAGVALVAVSAGPASAALVGADVEAIVPRDGLADLAAARFGPMEAACVAKGGCASSPLRSFYRHWTAREAWLKAIGVGLAALRDVEFDCGPGPVVRFRGTAGTMSDLRLHLLDSCPEYAVAVAATGPVTACVRLPPGTVP